MSNPSRTSEQPLYDFWKIGRDSRKELTIPKNGGGKGERIDLYIYGSKQEVKLKLAAKYGLNHDMLGKAWRVAEQYTEEQIRRWDAMVSKYGADFGPSHLKDLLVVKERKRRDRLTDMAIRKKWSSMELSLKIQAKFGRRNRVGRKPKMPDDPQELMTKLRMLCDKWINFCELAEVGGHGKLLSAVKNATLAVRDVKEHAEKTLTRLRGK